MKNIFLSVLRTKDLELGYRYDPLGKRREDKPERKHGCSRAPLAAIPQTTKVKGTSNINELLKRAVEAHGGLDRWNKVKAIKVAASITGGIWYVKGKGDFLKDVVLTAETRNERLTVDFPGQDKRAIFVPDRIAIETENGTLIEARDDPEKSFAGQQRETPWPGFHDSSNPPATMAIIPRKIRRSKFSRNTNQANNAVSTPSRLSNKEVLEAGVVVRPTISKTGATTPPERIAPISHGQSERPNDASILGALRRNLRVNRQRAKPTPDPR
jgi:hypothetical protein